MSPVVHQPPRPTPQGVHSRTFRAAPFDHGLSVAGLYAHHAKHSPDHAVFTYTDHDTGARHDVRYAEAWATIRKVARVVEENYSKTQHAKDGTGRPIISILALSGASFGVFLNMLESVC